MRRSKSEELGVGSTGADDYRGDTAGALNAILTEPPYGEDVEEAKVSSNTLQWYDREHPADARRT